MPRIERIDTRHFVVPLKEVLSVAKHGDHSHFELITATVRMNDGTHGTGYNVYRRARRQSDRRDDPS